MARLARNLFIAVCTLLWMVPLWLLVINAIAPSGTYNENSPQWWPHGFDLFGNIANAWSQSELGQGFLNSLGYALLCAAVAVLAAAAAGYAVVIMPLPFPTLWFWIIYAGTLFPFQMYLAPLFNSYAAVNLYDTRVGLGLVYVALTVPFAFFVIRNQVTTIPPEIGHAAQLDGAGWLRQFTRIYLPLMRPALAAAFAFQFTWVWNDLLFGITLARSTNVMPVMAELANLNSNYGTVPTPIILSGALIVSVPTVALFLGFQRVFARGIGATT